MGVKKCKKIKRLKNKIVMIDGKRVVVFAKNLLKKQAV